jgi:polysaccharide biosynthesis protein PslH
MSREQLDLLFVSQWPPSPATFGAQRRVEGLMMALRRRHRVSSVSLTSHASDLAVAERALRAYCDEVVLLPSPFEHGPQKRLLQLRALASRRSFERHQFGLRALRRALHDLLGRRRFDVVSVELPHLMQYELRRAPPGEPVPRLLLDEHNVEYDLARQSRDASEGVVRRLHHAVNYLKIRREEIGAWRSADGVAFTSRDDEARAHAVLPTLLSAVVPNGVDVDHFTPSPVFPDEDGRTVLFFGMQSYFPNQDAMQYFLRDIWPILERSHPRARVKVVGPNPTPELLAHRGPRVEVVGLVDDLRPHLAESACVIAPLRVGGGTRFKILEAMAMEKAVVSTTLGAEGIGAEPNREILIADEPAAFAASVGRVLDDSGLARRLGSTSRKLVEARYSWEAVVTELERFLRELIDRAPRAPTG